MMVSYQKPSRSELLYSERKLRKRRFRPGVIDRLRLKPRAIMTTDEFTRQFDGLASGGSMVYHRGNLALDRFIDPMVDEIAHRALQLGTKRMEAVNPTLTTGKLYDYKKPEAEDWGLGRATLLQRRRGPFVFEYVIIKVF